MDVEEEDEERELEGSGTGEDPRRGRHGRNEFGKRTLAKQQSLETEEANNL